MQTRCALRKGKPLFSFAQNKYFTHYLSVLLFIWCDVEVNLDQV
uniref:Uncharacterized protein n=1 Tax=Rhizophora mucronata TaxID=61149 RepID=A0A2P2IIZ4_RHIMU